MSDKLFKYIVQNISYEPDDTVFKRIKLNTKTRVIQNFLKQKVSAIKKKKTIAVNEIINHIKRNPKIIVTDVKEALRGKVKVFH